MINELLRGTGGHEDQKDDRDIIFRASQEEVDWIIGYDVRNELGGDLDVWDQGQQSSCGGQGTAQYLSVLQCREMVKKYGKSLILLRREHPEEVEKISAKAIYSQTALPGGGSYIRDNMNIAVDFGALFERDCPTYHNGQPITEEEVTDKSWITDDIRQLAKILGAKRYESILGYDMDTFAKAIKQNFGVVTGFSGNNNGTWRTERPQPPQSQVIMDGGKPVRVPIGVEWGHIVYVGAYGQDENGKYIAFPNSWGNLLGKRWYIGAPPGYGWQKLYINWFDSGAIFSPWTLTDKPNITMENEFIKIIKDANSAAVGFWIPAISEAALKSMAEAYQKTIHKKADGSIDWEKTIEGILTLK